MTTFVELFCGAGGLSLGLSNAGWRPLLAVDVWKDALQTYRANFPDHPALLDDVRSLTERRLRDELNETPDWVVGGPPCQGFSTVGKRERTDPRNRLVHEFARVVSVLQPRGFLIENVVGLRDMNFVDAVAKLFRKQGYAVSYMVLRAADYGVPQLRHRVFFIGDREGREFTGLEASHSPDRYVTVEDAIGDLPELSPGECAEKYDRPAITEYQRHMRLGSKVLQGHEASKHPAHLVKAISFIPDGGNRTYIPDRYQPKSGFHNSYSRLHSGSPAVAVTQNMGKPSGTRCIHPFQNRGLTAREGARLQGFPDRFHFSAGVTSQRLQIANAVSPILAERLGRELGVAPFAHVLLDAAE
ncbi:DNA cytosine methyltransferase [Roseiterribacter gracilis]|uniref:Cytosine-specific methyltransferase n=1 Tax=Roseiterribacter gracilis TaxID=2812848 RepID=A0A8S8X673_9PROT|nr:cytosine-specific methyltransferase [Rhodospirillales bacterium TMPK1]